MPQADIYGKALLDYYQGCFYAPLLLHNSYGEPEEMPVQVFFRDPADFSELEQYALHLCRGHVLDIGAGAGAHSLALQQVTDHVTAIEISSGACQVMISRRVKAVLQANVFQYQPRHRYDTLLMLMNGTGIAGTLNNFKTALQKLKRLLTNEGQIIIDSSDISYLYPDKLPKDHYFGEVSFQYEYKKNRGEWFPWLYLDQKMLKKISRAAGFEVQIVYEGIEGDFLAVLRN